MILLGLSLKLELIDISPSMPCVATAIQLQGKELSYNNIADSDAALDCCLAMVPPADSNCTNELQHACVIVKHANPCGVAVSSTNAKEAYEKAYSTDPTSAFGGIIAFNTTLEEETAAAILDKQFVEVLKLF